MEAIVKKDGIYSLIGISENEVELLYGIYDEVIINYEINDKDKILINNGASFIYNNGIIITDKLIAENNIAKQLNEYNKIIKKQEILKIASESDQLNILATIIDIITEGTTNQYIIEAKNKFNQIKNILIK